MIYKLDEIGLNAGKIWNVLNKNGPLSQEKLIKRTRLNDEKFYTAIGWLARENKICKDKINYKIGESNLTSHIGNNAGKIWELLKNFGEIDSEYIPKLADMPRKDTLLAIGWLAKEDKLKPKIVRPKKFQLHFGIK